MGAQGLTQKQRFWMHQLWADTGCNIEGTDCKRGWKKSDLSDRLDDDDDGGDDVDVTWLVSFL